MQTKCFLKMKCTCKDCKNHLILSMTPKKSLGASPSTPHPPQTECTEMYIALWQFLFAFNIPCSRKSIFLLYFKIQNILSPQNGSSYPPIAVPTSLSPHPLFNSWQPLICSVSTFFSSQEYHINRIMQY
jgi:hypothetical protein